MPAPKRLTLAGDENTIPRGAWSRWFAAGGDLGAASRESEAECHPWYQVLWLTGVDYFSTLGYQPGIAVLAAGALSPLATAILVGVTLLGVLPVYGEVAKRSYAGQGSIALLEHLLPGWWSKIFVLILLGFASTDFVITMTLSAADAAHHATQNAYLQPYLGGAQLEVTIVFLALLSLVFLKGFREAIGLAAAVAVPYLGLNAVVLAAGLREIFLHPDLWTRWNGELAHAGDWTGLCLASALVFPKLALGMSGFETGVSVMPLIAGGENSASGRPEGRISATKKLLICAASIMSVYLLASSFVTAVILTPAEYQIGGPASGRALAFLAHRQLGSVFGSFYDLSTLLILWFAGASALAGMLNLIPKYLPRFGMAPRWTAFRRPLVVALFAIELVVTLAFDANVEAQGGAYATGVLALMLSGSVAVAIAVWKERATTAAAPRAGWRTLYFAGISVVLAYTFFANVIERPDGVWIASLFIGIILVLGALSRQFRSTEIRVTELTLDDPQSQKLWESIVDKKVSLVPMEVDSQTERARKRKELQKHFVLSGPLAFVHVRLRDNRSDFYSHLTAELTREGEDYVLNVRGASAVANSIAFISELIDPTHIFIGLTGKNLMSQSLKYLILGEGETGLMIYTVLLRYWEWTPEDDVRPLIFLWSC